MKHSEQLLTVADVMRQLGISRRTVYRVAFLRQRAVYPTPANPRWHQADIDLYLAQNRGMRGNVRRPSRVRRSA